MQNFTTRVPSLVKLDDMINGFKAVMQDTKQSALVAAGLIGSVQVKEGLTIHVQGNENDWQAQAAVVVAGKTRLIASADFDNHDL